MRSVGQSFGAKGGLIFAAGVLLLASLVSFDFHHQLIRSYDWVTESEESLQILQYIQTLQEYAEAGVRAYVITGDVRRLEPYEVAKANIDFKLNQLLPRFEDRPAEKQEFDALCTLMAREMDYLSTLASIRRRQGLEAAARTVASEDEALHRDQLERLLSQLQVEERSLLEKRWQTAIEGARRTKIVIALGTLAGLLLLIGAYILLRRENEERRSAEREMGRARAFLNSIIEHIPYSIVVKEAENLRLSLVNRAAEFWLRRSREQLLDANAYDLYDREQAAAISEADRSVLNAGQVVDIIEESADGPIANVKIAHTQKIPISDECGGARFLLCISEDITERKRAERVLQMAHDAAVETARLKSEFIANMSHEIRTPIAIMTGMTALLMDTELSEQQKKFAGAVHRAGQNLSTIAKTLLDFSKIEAGQFALESTVFDVRGISQSVLDMLKEQAHAKGLSLASVIAPDVPQTLQGDAARLRQVLTQIVGNAVKFTGAGEVILRAAVSRENEAQVWVEFRISDTGIGLSEEVRAHIFEAFRQGDGSATRRFGGTGMGLTIARRTVELMGGEMGVESEPGKGSTFWWVLPFGKKESDGPLVQVPQLPWSRARLLIVDENLVHRELMRRHLNGWGLASETVSTGEAGLEILRRESRAGRMFQVCFVDMHLPDMDAIEFARMLRAEPAFADLRFVAMTSGEIPEAEVLQSLGFSQCLRKPIELADLHNGLLAVVGPVKQSAA